MIDEIKKNENNDSLPASKPEYRGFTFLPSFRESYDCLVEAGRQDLADLLLRAIVHYGTAKEIITRDPSIEIMMVGARRTMDDQHAKYDAKKMAKKIDDAANNSLYREYLKLKGDSTSSTK